LRILGPGLMNTEQIAGLITIATNSDADSTTISVRGRKPMNWPMMSGQNSSGQNATSVVSVEVITGQATSPRPRRAASLRDSPSVRRR
jgi:hypothetical protein